MLPDSSSNDVLRCMGPFLQHLLTQTTSMKWTGTNHSPSEIQTASFKKDSFRIGKGLNQSVHLTKINVNNAFKHTVMSGLPAPKLTTVHYFSRHLIATFPRCFSFNISGRVDFGSEKSGQWLLLTIWATSQDWHLCSWAYSVVVIGSGPLIQDYSLPVNRKGINESEDVRLGKQIWDPHVRLLVWLKDAGKRRGTWWCWVTVSSICLSSIHFQVK